MNCIQNRATPQGFTLIEILVAMILFSITLLTIFSSFRIFSTSANQVSQHITTEDSTYPGLHVMLSDLEQIFILPYPRYKRPELNPDPDPYRLEGTQSNMEGQPISKVSFTCLNRAPIGVFPTHGVARITYYAHRHEDRLDLHRADRAWPFDLSLSPCSDPVLIKGISNFTLTYTTKDGKETKTWDSDSKASDFSFPDQITIKISLAVDNEATILQSAVLLPVTRAPVR